MNSKSGWLISAVLLMSTSCAKPETTGQSDVKDKSAHHVGAFPPSSTQTDTVPHKPVGESDEPSESSHETDPDKSKNTQPHTDFPASSLTERDKPETCFHILNDFIKPQTRTVKAVTFKNRFTVVKDLRDSSKSGAFPALVRDSADNKIKFLKIFPKINTGMSEAAIKKDQGYLEIFLSCRLARLSLSSYLPEGMKASKFFADMYENGFLRSPDPFKEQDNYDDGYYPYILGEAIDNVTLTNFVTKPEEAKKPSNLGFDVDTAPPMVLESIFMQIMVALYNPYLYFNLTHNDLHPGNILLSKHEKADFYIDFEGKRMQLAGPLVKIIDFGLGEAEAYPQKLSALKLWIQKRPIIKELELLILTLRKDKLTLGTRLRIYAASLNQDIAMFNLILRAFKDKLNQRGSIVPTKTYCKDYNDCIRFMSHWWK